MNNVAGAAITFKKAAEPAFRDYARAILANAKALAEALTAHRCRARDRRDRKPPAGRRHGEEFRHGWTRGGARARAIGITTNKQVIPDDPRPPLRPSGVRLGTPACTTRGMTTDGHAAHRGLDRARAFKT